MKKFQNIAILLVGSEIALMGHGIFFESKVFCINH